MELKELDTICESGTISPRPAPSSSNRSQFSQKWSPWVFLTNKASQVVGYVTQKQGSRTRLRKLRGFPALWSEEERDSVELYTRSVLAIHSSISFWVGISNLLTESSSYDEENSWIVLPPSWGREVLYVVMGTVLLIATDSFYGNAGLPGSYLRQNWKWNRNPFIVIGRATLSLFGSVLCWTGIYNLLDLYTFQEHFKPIIRNVLYLICGVGGIIITNTFYDMSLVHPPGFEPVEFDNSSFTIRMHFRESIRCFASLIFQNMIWCGGYNVLEYNELRQCWWREFCYVIIGILFLYLSQSFVPSSWIFPEVPRSDFTELRQNDDNIPESVNTKEESENHRESVVDVQESNLTVFFYCRAMISLTAQIVHNTGVWVLLDVYITQDSPYRNGAYVVVGLCIVLLTGGGGREKIQMIFDRDRGYIPSPLA